MPARPIHKKYDVATKRELDAARDEASVAVTALRADVITLGEQLVGALNAGGVELQTRLDAIGADFAKRARAVEDAVDLKFRIEADRRDEIVRWLNIEFESRTLAGRWRRFLLRLRGSVDDERATATAAVQRGLRGWPFSKAEIDALGAGAWERRAEPASIADVEEHPRHHLPIEQ